MSRQPSNQRSDIYSRITTKIIADLEQGVRPWTRPWTTGQAASEVSRPLRHNGQPYTGINVLLLWSETIA
ncbi:ArdC-like ssDNA-binding domain-containing protein, partial [Rhizobium sp. PRIMUS64]